MLYIIIIITLKCRPGYNQQSHHFTKFHFNFLTLEGEFTILLLVCLVEVSESTVVLSI